MKRNRPSGVSREMVDRLLLTAAGADAIAVELACVGLCEHYGGEGETDDSCAGKDIVKHALESGQINGGHIEYIAHRPPPDPCRNGVLVKDLCGACPYPPDGCDFMAPHPVEGVTPCGGYRLLQSLLDAGAMTAADLQALLSRQK